MAGKDAAEFSGVLRQPAGGAEFGLGEAQAAHLGEHPVGRQLVTPARYLANAPGDGGGGDSVEEGGGCGQA